MTKLCLWIYRFFSQHKALRWSLLIISTILFIILGAQVQFEEDITKLLPATSESEEGSLAFSQLKVKDKIFVLLTSADPNEPLTPDDLVEYCDEFVDNMTEADSSNLLFSDILSQVDEMQMVDLVGYLADNFPLFVDTADYASIKALTADSSIAVNVAQTRAMLTSQAGMVMKDMLAADPIGLRNIIINEVKEIKDGLGSSQVIYAGHLFTPDTTVALAYVSPCFKSFDSKSGTKLVQLIEEQIDLLEAEHPDLKILFHGSPVQSVNNSRQIKKDLSLTLSISLLLVCIVIGLCFKNKSTIPTLILPVCYGACFALAMMFLIKGSMSLMALGIGAIVLGVALSYCLHVITHYKYVSTPERVIRDQAKPVFLGCLTTIGSFLGLMFTNSELLRDFGLFASLSLAGTTFFSLVFLPHFFNAERNRRSRKAFRALERFNSHSFEKHKWLIAAIVVLAAVCFYTQQWVTFDADLRNINYTSPKVKESQELLQSKTQPGLVTVYYATSDSSLDVALAQNRIMMSVLDSLKLEGKVKGFSKAALMFPTEEEQEARIAAWQNLWTEDRVDQTMKSVAVACNASGINPAFFSPFRDVLTQDYDLVYPYEDEILPEGLLANIIEFTDGVYMVYTSAQVREIDKKEVGKTLVKATNCIVVDPMFYTEEMVRSINDDFHTALNISMAFVFVILLLWFRNILLAVIAFIPMTLSWFIVLGIMGIFGLQFNLINIVISTFIFGIGVDYSIFVMDGLLSKAKSQSEPQLLVYHKTAIFFSAVVLVVSTGSLLLASHPALASIGIATIIGMSSAVILAYTLQPFLYHTVVKFILKRGIKVKWLEESGKKNNQ